MNVKEGNQRELGAYPERERIERRGTFARGIDMGAVVLGFLLGGCHTVFGAYPLGIALVSALPGRVWYALIGAAFGSLLRGEGGIIYAMAALLAVLLRIIISGTRQGTERAEGEEAKAERRLFGESVGLRISCAVISSFVSALYELLLNGMNLAGVLYGSAMMLISGLGCAFFSCAFYHGVGVRDLIFSHGRIFARRESAKERASLVLFRIGLLSFVFAVSLSLLRFDLFGIDLAFVFSAAVAMLAAKRFGALYGAVTGFVAAVGASGIYSPAFLIGGAALGALFPLGAWMAIAAGGVGVAVWCAYIGGVSGFLTVLPEFLIASLLMMPLFRYLEREREPQRGDSVKRRATDMVGTMALSYRDRREALAPRLGAALDNMSRVASAYLSSSDSISAATAARMVREAADNDASEREMNDAMTDNLEALLTARGFFGGVVRVFGKSRPYVICAAEDKDGDRISSPELHRDMEDALGVLLTEPEYYRRAEMVVMVAESRKRLVLEGAFASSVGGRAEISGDSMRIFETENGFGFGVLSDGMGSGEEANRTSRFVTDFLAASLGTGASVSSIIAAMNCTIRARQEECGASVDVFALDLVNGNACFVKSGAASSFIKRGGSLFRIRSGTLPVGVMKEVDAERITATVREGDYVIMLSDGIVEDADAPWLIELLNRPVTLPLKDYANAILNEATPLTATDDDKSVMVLRVSARCASR